MNKPEVHFREILQIIAGPKKGLIVQVLHVDEGLVHAFMRDLGGAPNFITLKDEDEYEIVGLARIGPRQDAESRQTPQVPPPIDAQALLSEPLPTGTPIVPMDQEPAPEEKPKRKRGRRIPFRPGWKRP